MNASGFIPYQHVERLGTSETEGILDGPVYIFAKIDGTNGNVWNNNGTICCGTRSKMLGDNDDNRGFKKHVLEHTNIPALLAEYPHWRLYGEFLVPHTLKSYLPDAWNKFYVFDITVPSGDKEIYIPYEQYKLALGQFGIEYIPCMATVENAQPITFDRFIDQNNYLVKDGVGEGIVIKRYDFVNKYGRTVWAKVVAPQFKWGHLKTMGSPNLSGGAVVEQAIVAEFVTLDLVNKVYAKVCEDHAEDTMEGPWSKRRIPMLLGICWHELITEEMWHILKKFKAHPVIDFKLLERLTIAKVKELRSDLF